MKNQFVVPTSFDCGFRKVQCFYDSNQIYGEDKTVGLNCLGTGEIYMQTPVKNRIDEQAVSQAFCHELVHSILYTMGESELCHNERFVDAFAHLLTQFELTKKGDLLKIWARDLEKKAEKKAKKEEKKSAIAF